MDKKFFVPYKTAQQLKEKGYPQDKSDYGYFDNGDSHPLIMFPADNFDCAAPTYHEVVDWLQEKGIRIEVRVAYQFREKQWSWCGYVYVVEDEDYETSQLADWCSTREQALNASILKALEML